MHSRSSSVASSIRLNQSGPVERAAAPLSYTPTRNPGGDLGSDLLEASRSLQSPGIRTPSGANRVIVEPYQIHSGLSSRKRNRSGFTPDGASPHSTYGHRIYSVPRLPTGFLPTLSKRSERRSATKLRIQDPTSREPFFFTSQERQAIAELVHANPRECDRHSNCTDCHNLEYAYFENKTMPTSMPPEERQKIINNNRSLRNIKNV